MAKRYGWVALLSLAFIVSLSLLLGRPGLAQSTTSNVTVNIGVGDTILTVTGMTAPGALVTIIDGDNVVGSTVADGGGVYWQQFTAQTPGIHNLQVYSEDQANRLTDVISQQVTVQEHAETIVDIFLPPTLELSHAALEIGQDLQLSGSTAPNAQIVITLDGNNPLQTTADSSGQWHYGISNLAVGPHSVYVVASTSGGDHSFPTSQRSFTVLPQAPSSALPPQVPVITYPHQGDIITDSSIAVQGTAEPNSRIELYNGDRLIGSAFADRLGRWRILLGLTLPSYELRARACTTICSGFSATVRFFFQPSTGSKPRGEQMIIFLDRYSFTVQQGETVHPLLHIRGGNAPYKTVITWGDDHETVTSSQLDVTLNHLYKTPGTYTANLIVEDKSGQRQQLTFAVDVLPKPSLVRRFLPIGFVWLALALVIIAFVLYILRLAHKNRQ